MIDFAKESDELKGYFKRYMNDLDTLFMLVSTYYGKKLYDRDSLLIFDEVQMFPTARTAIKYLVADGRYDYLETGSLISIRENVRDIVIPSEERHLRMYPLDFEEFAWAFGEEVLIEYIRQCFEKKEPLERSLHNSAMLLFKQYMLIGAQYKTKVLAIFDQIPGLLVSHAFDENVIAQMLVANGHKLYFYTHYSEEKHRNDMEIDFLLSNNSKIKYKLFPVEVKSGKKYTTASLLRFREKYKSRIGVCYIIHPRNFTMKDMTICL